MTGRMNDLARGPAAGSGCGTGLLRLRSPSQPVTTRGPCSPGTALRSCRCSTPTSISRLTTVVTPTPRPWRHVQLSERVLTDHRPRRWPQVSPILDIACGRVRGGCPPDPRRLRPGLRLPDARQRVHLPGCHTVVGAWRPDRLGDRYRGVRLLASCRPP